MYRLPIVVILLAILSCSCEKTSDKKQLSSSFVYDSINKVQVNRSGSDELKEIIYSMYLPTDLIDIFSSTGTSYHPEYIASIEDLIMFTDPEKAALMLGVYGVDMAYLKLLGQDIDAMHYFSAIETLSGTLGIPRTIFEPAILQLEEYYQIPDSLNAIVKRVYINTDWYFKENNQEHLAALALTGGWVEAMCIAASIYTNDGQNRSIAERLLQQKLSLNSVYYTLSNYTESLTITGYLLMLNKLRKVYQKVKILYPKSQLSVNTETKKIQSGRPVFEYEPSTLAELLVLINGIRNELIKPVALK